MEFDTKKLPASSDGVAPDGSDVRILLGLDRGSMAHFELGSGRVSRAVAHRTVEEIWYVLKGHGEMWRQQGGRDETVMLEPGVCLSIPAGTRFQFRCLGGEPLAVIAVTMPPWPGEREAYEVDGGLAAESLRPLSRRPASPSAAPRGAIEATPGGLR